MNTCKTCKYWQGAFFKSGINYSGPCSFITTFDTKSAVLEVDTKYPEFVSKVSLMTTLDFGCTLWKDENEQIPLE